MIDHVTVTMSHLSRFDVQTSGNHRLCSKGALVGRGKDPDVKSESN